ncbi:hypothetical protein OsccyDRAFT_3445 [Leptolyngbyaceae cyanobacterium JSC-12]|nr:hypothetical protein OsccyDRAFT_3445 [Leptolyngbyaceae cyanobacterium JSC-12]
MSMANKVLSSDQRQVELQDASEILHRLASEELLIVNSRRRNGVIIYKQYYAEFAGPGAAVGGFFDVDCRQIIPVGELSLVYPADQEERQKAYLIRRQWIRLTHQLTDNPLPMQRAQMILNQFENYFGTETVEQLPDEAFALMVGVLPQTVRTLRQNSANGDVRT